MTKEARVKLLEQELKTVKQQANSGVGPMGPGAPTSNSGSAGRDSSQQLPSNLNAANLSDAPVMPPPRPNSFIDRQIQDRSPSEQMPTSIPTSSLARTSSLKNRPSGQTWDLVPEPSQSTLPQPRNDPARQVNLVADVVLSSTDKNGAGLVTATGYSVPRPHQQSFRADSLRSSPRTVEEDSSQPAVLEGFNAEALQPQLRYGDSISLLPDGMNAAVAYAGAEDGRAWVEVLDREIGVPPNLRDCQWRVQPARHYVEAKKLEKLMKTSDWDGGKKLPMPDPPHHGQNLEDYAGESSD